MGVWSPGSGATAGDDTFTGDGSNDVADGLAGNDTLLGAAGDDTLTGGDGADTLDGGDNNDVLNAGALDTLIGGNGNDVVHFSFAEDALLDLSNVTFAAGEFNGTMNSGLYDQNVFANTLISGVESIDIVATGPLSFIGSNGVETVTAASGDLSGNGGDDVLTILAGSGSNIDGGDGADTLTGGTGDDDIHGGAGADIIDGGDSSTGLNGVPGDTANYFDSSAGVSINLALGTASGGDAQGDVITNIENLTGSAFNDTLTGDGGNNALVGGDGADVLHGGLGDDTLSGRDGVDTINGDDGNDTIEGGAGADVLDGGAGSNTLSYEFSLAGVQVDLSTNTLSGGDAQGDTIANFENVTGSGYADILTGDDNANVLDASSGNDVLRGGGGDDTLMVGHGGTQTFDGGAGIDTLDFSQTTLNSVAVNLQTGQSLFSPFGSLQITFTSIENLVGGFGADTLTGDGNANHLWGGASTGADRLDGGAGDDILEGQAGNDVLIGGDGADTLVGGDSTDTLQGGNGADILNGGDGVDFADYSDSTAGVSVNLLTGVAGGGYAAGDTLISIEYLTGSGFGDTLTGDTNANVLAGGGGNDILSGGDGDDGLNGGVGADTLIGGAGFDLAQYSLATAGVVANLTDASQNTGEAAGDTYSSIEGLVGSTFADTLTGDANANRLSGSSGNDTLNGLGGDDSISGGSGTDTLNGGDGNDTLDGGSGTNTLNGGNGDDILVGDTILSTNHYDGGAGTDVVSYALAADAADVDLTNALTGESFVNVENLIGSAFNDTLRGDAGANALSGGDGDDALEGRAGADALDGGAGADTASYASASAGVTASLLTPGANIGDAAGDAYVSIENLVGSALNDTLTGNGGANALDGRAGADAMNGGAGDDTYVVDNAGDTVTEAANNGTDLVQASISYTLTANVENLTLNFETADINGTGNVLSNTITGNFYANVLDGAGGADVMIGLDGNDTYIVDNAGDVVTEDSTFSSGIDEVRSSVTYAIGANIENLTLTGAAAINGTGNELANTIVGNSAANVLTGNDGADTLNGGAGADTMSGGAGDDIYLVDNVNDVASEISASDGTDTVQSSVTFQLGANLENLTLLGSAAINGIGNTLANMITGNSAANTLNGGAGADTMIGGSGNDTYVVDNAGDIVTEASGGGTDLVQSSISYQLGAFVEKLTLTGPAAINGIGNTLANTIYGNSGANLINGGAGADTMIGGGGNDVYVVDNVGDVVTETANAGTDWVQSSITYVLGDNVERLTLTGTAAINGTGNGLGNYMVGNSGVNVLDGGIGDDVINGGAGNDVLIGGAGADKVTGGDGVDAASYATATAGVTANLFDHTLNSGDAAGDIFSSIEVLIGSNFNDTLTGTSAANRLDGGAGADTMIGGAGNDTYIVDNAGDVVSETLSASGGVDKVQSSISYTLGANLENLTLTGSAAINGTGNSLANTLYGNSGANTLNGGTGDDTLLGGAGHDILKGGAGGDHFVFSSLNAADSDTISDFSHADDSIELDNAIFTALGPDGALASTAFWSSSTGVAHDADDRVIYNSVTGQLYYDADGNGAGAAILIAALSAHPTLDATDFFTI